MERWVGGEIKRKFLLIEEIVKYSNGGREKSIKLKDPPFDPGSPQSVMIGDGEIIVEILWKVYKIEGKWKS